MKNRLQNSRHHYFSHEMVTVNTPRDSGASIANAWSLRSIARSSGCRNEHWHQSLSVTVMQLLSITQTVTFRPRQWPTRRAGPAAANIPSGPVANHVLSPRTVLPANDSGRTVGRGVAGISVSCGSARLGPNLGDTGHVWTTTGWNIQDGTGPMTEGCLEDTDPPRMTAETPAKAAPQSTQKMRVRFLTGHSGGRRPTPLFR